MKMDHLKFFIDGSWVKPIKTATIDVINPATEKVFTRISAGSAGDVDRGLEPEAGLRESAEAVPLNRVCSAGEVAHMVLYACSDSAAFITGYPHDL